MNCETYKFGGIHFAILKINNIPGGVFGRGRTVQEAIKDAFDIYLKKNIKSPYYGQI